MKQFEQRKFTIGILIILVGILLLSRLFYIQVIEDKYKVSAENNSQRIITNYPARGLIYDRNGKLLVSNQATYDLMVIPRRVKNIDINDFCKILDIDTLTFNKKLKKCKRYSQYRPSIFMPQINYETYAILQEKMHKFQGFFVQTRTLRKYQYNSAAHVLGYIAEVNNREIKKNSYYTMGDYIGKSGVEYTYEKYLRGVKGRTINLVDVHNRIKGKYKNGAYDIHPVIGSNIKLTIDIDLQMYAEKLMQNKRGSVVAIEPSTGEILAKVSAPSYDPNLFVGNLRNKYYRIYRKDKNKPLFDRAMMATYPPGSIFKLPQALIALEEGVINENTEFPCHGGYQVGNFRLKCHVHSSPLDLKHSIQQSCNAYYCYTFRRILEQEKYKRPREAYKVWRQYIKSFGFDSKLGVDIPYERSGFIPNVKYWDKKYRTQRWKALNIISLSIGQGDILITPLQMANMGASIANRGYYKTPHIVKEISNNTIDSSYVNLHKVNISKEYFKPVIEGMEMVVNKPKGTGRLAYTKDIDICGKTGTVQNPHGEAHSVFLAFAPKENPKIALIIYVENGVWGSRYAAPIAGLLIEKYLKGNISKSKKGLEKRMIEADLITEKE